MQQHGQSNWQQVRAMVCTCHSQHGLQVSKSMQGWRRNGAQCLQRWSKTLAPHRKGYWNETEILQLQYAVRTAAWRVCCDVRVSQVKAYGGEGNWSLVQRHVSTRTDMQVRDLAHPQSSTEHSVTELCEHYVTLSYVLH